ncbi:unnamed protein product, partial [Oikopleura dioica]
FAAIEGKKSFQDKENIRPKNKFLLALKIINSCE